MHEAGVKRKGIIASSKYRFAYIRKAARRFHMMAKEEKK